MPLMPGAEPYRHDGGEVGVLLCHGFTGSPQSLRPWGEYLAERGLSVSLPLLPGHGTRWQDMQLTGWQDWYAEVDRELRGLTARCRQVFVFGLSMGGALTLRLAARHSAAVSGIALVNPSVKPDSVTCLECGKKMKMLKRHLSTDHGLSTEDYRTRWNLGSDYPLVAPNYAEKRRELAKKIGLGRKPGQKRGRKKKVAA